MDILLHIDHLDKRRLIDNVYSLRNQFVMVEQDIVSLFNTNHSMVQDLMFVCRHSFPDSCAFLTDNLEQQSLVEQGYRPSPEDGILPCSLIASPSRVFTEEGIMLICILINSERAGQISNKIIQVFASLREIYI